jgi:hypothetical protein
LHKETEVEDRISGSNYRKTRPDRRNTRLECRFTLPECRFTRPECRFTVPECRFTRPECCNTRPECWFTGPECRFTLPECRFTLPECRFTLPECRFTWSECWFTRPECRKKKRKPAREHWRRAFDYYWKGDRRRTIKEARLAMRSVPPRGSGWVCFRILPRGKTKDARSVVLLHSQPTRYGEVVMTSSPQTHPLPRGGNDFIASNML